jgi:hypothetical protein
MLIYISSLTPLGKDVPLRGTTGSIATYFGELERPEIRSVNWERVMTEFDEISHTPPGESLLLIFIHGREGSEGTTRKVIPHSPGQRTRHYIDTHTHACP